MDGGKLFPTEWAETASDGSFDWWEDTRSIDIDLDSLEAWAVASHIAGAFRLRRISRIQKRRLWTEYRSFRDAIVAPRSQQGLPNEKLLFYGTGCENVEDVLQHLDGLDPRLSPGGCYGQGVYLCETPENVIASSLTRRQNSREPSPGQRIVQLLVVRAALGTPQDFGTHADATTRAMTMPGVRLLGPPKVRYGSVKAFGTLTKALAPPGTHVSCEDCDSTLFVVYDARQAYPAYVVEFECPNTHASPSTPACLLSSCADSDDFFIGTPRDDCEAGNCVSTPLKQSDRTLQKSPSQTSTASFESLCDQDALSSVVAGDSPDSCSSCCPTFSRSSSGTFSVGAGGSPDDSETSSLLGYSGSSSRGDACSTDGDLTTSYSGVACHASDDIDVYRCEAAQILVNLLAAAAVDRQVFATAAIAAAAAADKLMRTALVRSGVVPLLAAMLRECSCPSVSLHSAEALRNISAASQQDNYRLRIIVANGVVPLLVSLLRGGNSAARIHATAALSNIASGAPEFKVVVMAAGATPVLVAIIQSEANDGRAQAAATLQNLVCGGDGNSCQVFVASGGIPPLISLMQHHLCAARVLAAVAVQNLASVGRTQVLSALVTAGVVAPLVAMLQDVASPEGKVCAAGALKNLAIGSAERKALLAASGAIAALVSLLCDTTFSAGQGAAAGALRNLVAKNDPEHLAAVVTAGAIPPLVSLVRSSAVDTIEAGGPPPQAAQVAQRQLDAAATLQSLTHADTGCKTDIVAAGALAPLVRMLHVAAPKGQTCAAGALLNLSSGSRRRKTLVVKCGAIPLLVAMLRHPGCTHDGKTFALGTLRSISPKDDPERLASIVTAGGIPLLVETLQDTSSVGRAHAAKLLERIALDPHIGDAVPAGARAILPAVLATAGSPVRRRSGLANRKTASPFSTLQSIDET